MEELAAAVGSAHTAHAWGPIVLNRAARAERQLLKVVAFNARGGRSLDKISTLTSPSSVERSGHRPAI